MDENEVDLKLLFGDIDEEFRTIDTNVVPLPTLIHHREIGHRFTQTTAQHFETWREDSFVEREHSHIACQIPPSASEKATFLLAFSPDGTKVASSHLDHNIYVTDVRNGKCICTLKGHPRSPWCVAFHPSSNEIVASGCLGGEVRVWDLKGGSEVWTPDKKSVIASLAFHPTDQVLVIATENDLYFWDWFCPEPFAKISTASKLEKIKYVEFDPLGYKLITGIRIVHSDRHQMENSHSNHTANNDSTNNNSSDLFMRGTLPANPRSSLPRLSRFLNRINNRCMPNQTSSPLDANNQTDPPPVGLLTSSQRDALTNARQFAESENARMERLGNMDTGTGMAPGPSSLSDLHFPQEGSSTLSSPRRRLLPRYALPPEEEPPRPLLGPDFRPLARPPPAPSDDSASSSSIDSGSSVTSGLSGASHERNTRLSLLWTSRLSRPGGNESDTSAGGGYDLEERRGEGSVMRGGAPSVPPPRGSQTGLEATPAPTPLEERTADDTARERDRESHADTRSFWSSTGGLPRGRLPPRRVLGDDEDDDSDGDSSQRSSRHAGQGGRWMYYRGKIPPVPSRNRSSMRNDTGAAGSSGATSRRIFKTRSPSRGVGTQRHATEDPLAIPGPSGVSGSSNLPNLSFSELIGQNSSLGRGQNQSSLLDPQFGVQLLSRHIENMQSICRLLSIPRAQLELTRHRNDISQLQQIRSMLYDIQHQIRSLQRASAEQTISDGIPGGARETLNSLSVDPEPLGAELLNSGARGISDEVEVEVNIGTEDTDNYSFSTLAEEDPEQFSSNLILNPLETPDSVPSLEPIPENEPTSRTGTSFRISNRTSRSSSRTLRNLVAASLRNRRTARNRLVWTGLLRRWSTLRRTSRARLHSPSPGVDALRREKRRRLLLGRRVAERRASGTAPGTSNSSGAFNPETGPLFPAYSATGTQRTEDPTTPSSSSSAPRSRRRHCIDWQRRLRSTFASETNRRRENAPLEAEGRLPSNTDDTESQGSGVLRLMSNAGSSRETEVTMATSSRHNASNNLNEDEDMQDTPEREPRAGPPTTSLSSRIATMLSQQLLRENNEGTDTPTTTLGASRVPLGATIRARQRHFTQSRQSMLERNHTSRSPFRASAYANAASPYSLPPLPTPFDDLPPVPSALPEDLETSGDFSQPVYQSLRNLRREIMISHRNRMLRRSSSSLVSGRDLAGATLAAINPALATEQDRQRESFRQERRESYRHMLQLMADRLNLMMNQSLSVGATPRREGSGGTGNPFDLQDVGEDLDAPGGNGASPQSARRRAANLRSSARRPLLANVLRDEYEPGPAASAGPPSALDRHMQNLRLLVRLALHLIYQLLNFICNQNLSYEERPISRLPNPFREESELAPRGHRSGSNLSTASAPAPAEASLDSNFEMDIEPGLTNLTTLLETVRMASEELRQDALANSEQPSGAEGSSGPRRCGVRARRNAMAYEEPPSGERGTQASDALPERATGSSLRSADGAYSGSAVRRRLTDFLIRTGGYSARGTNNVSTERTNGSSPREGASNEAEATRDSSTPRIQRPLPTTPTVHLRDLRAPLLIPQIVLSDMSQEAASVPSSTASTQAPQVPQSPSLGPSEDLNFHLRTFGGIPLRLLGRQNAVDRRSPDSEDSNGMEHNNNQPDAGERPFSFNSSASATRHPFRHWNNPSYSASNGGVQNSPLNLSPYLDREGDQYLYMQQPYFMMTSRNIAGSLFDPYSPGLYNSDNSYYRIQAWDFSHFDIPDISDGFSNVVVPRCRIHFDASVSISVDGTLLAAVLPDSQALTQIGVYSLEGKTLGQLLYSSSIGFNIVCVSFSPTMRHLVVGIPSRRLGVHHNEKQVIGRIYKLCQYTSSSYRLGHSGYLKLCKAIKLESELRQSSLNCIRWIPKAGMGLVYGTNKGQLTVIR